MLRVGEVARFLHVSKSTTYEWVKRRLLPHIRIRGVNRPDFTGDLIP